MLQLLTDSLAQFFLQKCYVLQLLGTEPLPGFALDLTGGLPCPDPLYWTP